VRTEKKKKVGLWLKRDSANLKKGVWRSEAEGVAEPSGNLRWEKRKRNGTAPRGPSLCSEMQFW